jgi:XTP/dITP diphosphohydrolase
VRPQLLIATSNAHKIAEFRELLEGSGWDVVSPADVGVDLEVDESGSSYEENARIKARAFTDASGLPSLADDSGLEVDALGGEPGPLHHLRGWDGIDNDDRIAILLGRLEGVKERACRYKAVVAVAFPDGIEIVGSGSCEGQVATRPEGDSGFGYDPVFFLPGAGKTMAQIAPSEKNRVSHRALALEKIREALRSRASVSLESTRRTN